ncbi:MAG TPA: acyl-CoA thioesterase domain-containing protein [Nocardia sp.]|uniref:acyl-CoA thioesterase n=1 Tax=Nocardia sp. TaxID=1821 RepID=UPI002B4AFFB2|nr:acyl-CoA thioesterase domain-containing protein [Nocardia sp.]HLS75496.1 acyl-CoA thioesterase domain-containing protein [Nocardia sp.]
MPDLWSDLVACLDLTRVPPAGHGGGGAAPSDARPPDAEFQFEGSNQQLPYHRVFGGQILGQVVRAAALSFPGKQLKSLHALFPREGRSEEPIRYRVRACHEGRTFASATVIAEQSAGVVATASLSLHTPEQGPRRQSTDPVPVLPSAEHKADWDLLPWEVRARREIDDKGSSAPEFEFWMRTPTVDPALAAPLAAYATDLTLIGTALLPQEGFSQSGNGTAFLSAVTSHTLWFHGAFRSDDWLLLRQHSPILAHGRGFGRGDILTESGELVASYAQEAMIRLPVS